MLSEYNHKKMRIIFFAILFVSIYDTAFSCTNRLDGKVVRAAGDWSAAPTWNAVN